MRKKGILIVEREDYYRTHYAISLKEHAILFKRSNKDISVLEEFKYDIIVLKYTSKDAIRGFRYKELVEKIRKKNPKAKIIIPTSFEKKGGELLQLGYCDYTCTKTTLPATIKGVMKNLRKNLIPK